MGSEREESRWEASQHLEDGCQFGFVLPFDLFFFLPPDAHIVQCVQQHDVWERALDQKARLGSQMCSWCSSQGFELHCAAGFFLTLLSSSPYPRENPSLVGDRPITEHLTNLPRCKCNDPH